MQEVIAPTGESKMSRVLADFPGARRALFSHYHIGGCQSCAYDDSETLAEVCTRNELDDAVVITTILESHEQDLQFLIDPQDLSSLLEDRAEDILLIDTRTREEHESVSLPGSILLTQELQTKYFAHPPREEIIFYDHLGANTLDTCSWFSGHGLKNCRALRGGIDAWSREVDKSVPRYRLEIENS